MDKKLIAAALLTLPMAAMADTTIYGSLRMGLTHQTINGNATQNAIQDQISDIGFKGSENLDNGLKAVWQIESRLHMDGSADSSITSHPTFVGLDGGDLGLLRLGYVNNMLNDQYAVDHQQWQHNSPVFNGTLPAVGSDGLVVFANSGDRMKNAVRYDSATFAGFSASVAYGFGENQTNVARSDDSTTASDQFGLGLNYQYGDLAAHYALQHEANPFKGLDSTNTISTNGNKAATKQLFELDYRANSLFVSGAYQIATGYDWTDNYAGDGILSASNAPVGFVAPYNTVADQIKTRQAAFSVAYTMGPWTPKFSVAKGWNMQANDGTIGDSGYSQFVLGVSYALSKRTTAGLSFGSLKFDKGTAFAQAMNDGQNVTVKSTSISLGHSF